MSSSNTTFPLLNYYAWKSRLDDVRDLEKRILELDAQEKAERKRKSK
jgi:hypothetical protein